MVARHAEKSEALGLPERQPGIGGLGGGLGKRELLCHPVPTCASGYKDQPPPDELSTGGSNARGTHIHTPHTHMLGLDTLCCVPSINLFPLSVLSTCNLCFFPTTHLKNVNSMRPRVHVKTLIQTCTWHSVQINLNAVL